MLEHVHQQQVEIGIRIHHLHLQDVARKQDLVGGRAEFHRATDEARQPRLTVFAEMSEAHARRPQVTAGELSANSNQQRHPEFDLVSIGLATHADVADGQTHQAAVDELLQHAFVHHRAVACAPLEDFAQVVRGREYVVQQPGHAQLEPGRELQSQQVVTQFVRHQVQEFDLVSGRDSRLRIVDGLDGQADPPQQRPHGNTARARV